MSCMCLVGRCLEKVAGNAFAFKYRIMWEVNFFKLKNIYLSFTLLVIFLIGGRH